MLTRIILGLLLTSTVLFAQSSTTHGNLIRIPFDAAQINPADTVGSWINRSINNGYFLTGYSNIIHTQQDTLFEKRQEQDDPLFGMSTRLYLENPTADTSAPSGCWQGYYDVPEPYIIPITIPFRVENGAWLMNGVYNTSFISDEGEITILPSENRFYYISGKINDKYLTVFKKDLIEPTYDLYLLDLSGSPSFDTTNGEKVYFDFPAAPYKMKNINGSLYLAGIDSLPEMYPRLCLFDLQGNTFHYIKTIVDGSVKWEFRNNHLFYYDGTHLIRYDYNPADSSFINKTPIAAGVVFSNDNFTISVQMLPDSIYIYDNDNGQLINSISIENLIIPHRFIIDSPYVYIHQTTYLTDVKDEPNKLLSYKLKVYPNPFNPATNVVYTLPERAMAEIRMYDILGREVREIFSGEAEAGTHTQVIDGNNLSSGVYFIRFTSQNYADTKKVLLLK